MFSESKVTEIYCMADDFCKEFALQQEKYMVEDKKHKHRNNPNRMSDVEIRVILILFHSSGFRCFKHYYKESLTCLPQPADTDSQNFRGTCRTRKMLYGMVFRIQTASGNQ